MDLYIREMHVGQYDGRAHLLSEGRGITYNYYTKLQPFYVQYRGGAGNWGAPYPPLPEDPELPCPWNSVAEFEARLQELKQLSEESR